MGFSPFSAAFCTIGGMIGNNAAGSHSLAYGAVVDNLLAATFLTSDGRVRRWTRDSRDTMARSVGEIAASFDNPWPKIAKNSSGYRLDRVLDDGFHPHRVLCGSEGTLGVIMEATFKTHPIPRHVETLLAGFRSSQHALAAVPPLLDHQPLAIELMDEAALTVVAKHHAGLPRLARTAAACLVIDVEGSARRAAAALDGAPGLQGVRIARGAAQRERLWAARIAVEPLLRSLGGRRRPLPFIEDVVVPVERQVDYLEGVREILDREFLQAPLYGHAGQGNLHIRPFLD